jgi:diacylglycerol kinase family enzyme
MKHLLIINPKSFPNNHGMSEFISSATQILGDSATVIISRYPRYAISKVHNFLKEAAGQNERVRVYAVGGDGILFDCLNGILCYPETELASVPYGNANDFLRAFGSENIPLFRDIELLSKSPSVPTDIIEYGENSALSIVSLGLEGSAILVTEKMAKRLSKIPFMRKLIPTLYTLGAVVVIFNRKLRSQYYNVIIDGVDYSGEYVDINIGNSFGNGGKNAANPYAVPNDGLLDAVFIKKMSLIKCLLTVGPFVRGEFEKLSDRFIHVRFKKLYASSPDSIRICADGEAFYTSEVNIEINPGAIQILAPEGVSYRPFKEYKGNDQRGLNEK